MGTASAVPFFYTQREVVTVAYDWVKIKNDYVNGGGSCRKLAEKYNIPYSTIRDRSSKEKWKKQKDENRSKTVAKAEQKTIEKTSDAISDEATADHRARAAFWDRLAGWLEKHPNVEDVKEFRAMLQCYIDLHETGDYSTVEDNPDDGFIEAIRGEAADTWQD